jgi:HK97 gp10 family phage protein
MSGTTVTVKVNYNRLPQVRGKVREGASRVIRECALQIEGDAKMACPVDTGTLVNSISTETGDLEATVSTDSGYGAYVNFGTRRMAPRPFMTSAADRNIPQLKSKLQAMLGNL